MKKLLVIAIALLSVNSAHAAKYLCWGLDGATMTRVDITNEAKDIGTLDGHRVQFIDNGNNSFGFNIILEENKQFISLVVPAGDFSITQYVNDKFTQVICTTSR